MITIVNVDTILPCKEVCKIERADIMHKHCEHFDCCECKYYKFLPNNEYGMEDCVHIYFLFHNYLVIGDRMYEITDEEKHIIMQLDKYCHNKVCTACRYGNEIIRDTEGRKILCAVERIIAHKIIRGEITKDQYDIVKGGNE